MSLLINDELIWISIPRNASTSIERSLYNSNLKITHFNNEYNREKIGPGNPKFKHAHYRLNKLEEKWVNKKTICVKRDWLDRWFSCLEHIWYTIELIGLTPTIKYNEIDNQYIYEIFDKKLYNAILTPTNEFEVLKHFVKDSIDDLHKKKEEDRRIVGYFSYDCNLLLSQNYWTSNRKCTYEFNLNEIWKLEDFFLYSYNEIIKIEKFNTSKGLKNKIIINDDLKNFIWNFTEAQYLKNNKLI